MGSQSSICSCSRRSFLKTGLGCGAYTLLASQWAPLSVTKAFAATPGGETVVTEPYARVEKLAEGVWAVVSTPLTGGFTTVSNGGIVQGKDGVLAIEGFMSPKGGEWLRSLAEKLTGQPLTHVALTHYHSDHVGGIKGYLEKDDTPEVIATEKTKSVMTNGDVVTMSKMDTVDLGGRNVRFDSLSGHTDSDMTISIDEPSITWCGDLLWNGMFPNYVDAKPTTLLSNCKDLLSDTSATFIPGHGAIPNDLEIKNYISLLENIGEAAQRSIKAGIAASDAWKEYKVPENLGTWSLFRPNIFEAAFVAWERESKK
jgi:glyoxylase-like metal-dependent hydrolase (beta-lactamase superfamily II)